MNYRQVMKILFTELNYLQVSKMEFINEVIINSLLEDEKLNDIHLQRDIINKASDAKGLSLKDSAALLNITDPEILDELFHKAKEVKEKIYGNRLVLFAPLYVTNLCVNNCLYCAFRKDNKELIAQDFNYLMKLKQKQDILCLQGRREFYLLQVSIQKKQVWNFLERQSIEFIALI